MTRKKIQAGPKWISSRARIPDPQGRAERNLKFLRLLVHHKSGRPVQIDPWMERIIRKIYGPSDADGNRLTRVVFLQVGRGNRKTSLGACLCLLHTFGPERVPGGQVVSAAADRKQARIAYEEALGVVSATQKLANPSVSRPQDFKSRLVHHKSGAVYEAISSDAATNYGRTPSFALVDELWAFKKPDLWHAIRTGLNKAPNSLLVVLTTAGRGQDSPDFGIYEYAKKVEAGEIIDPGFLPIIFEAPKDCDWRDEKIWAAVNPGLKYGYPDIAGLRQFAREAEHRPADREAFQQFHLGVRQEHSTSPYIGADIFERGRAAIQESDLRGKPCWVAVDASTTRDLTGVLAAFRDGGNYLVKCWGFVPESDIQIRADRDGVPYPRWREQGWIRATPGEVIDHRAVEKFIRDELLAKHDVREIVSDPAYAQQIMGPLTDDGFPTAYLRQGWATQSPALNVLEAAAISGRIKWDSPVLKWNMGNVQIHTDSAGNRTMHKGLSRDRIDLACCLWMAVSRAEADEGGASLLGTEKFNPEDFLIPMWS